MKNNNEFVFVFSGRLPIKQKSFSYLMWIILVCLYALPFNIQANTLSSPGVTDLSIKMYQTAESSGEQTESSEEEDPDC